MVKGYKPPVCGFLGLYDEYADITIDILKKHEITLRPDLEGITRIAICSVFAEKMQENDYKGDSCDRKNCPYGGDCNGEIKKKHLKDKNMKTPSMSLLKCRYTRTLQDRRKILEQLSKEAKTSSSVSVSELLYECGKDDFLREALEEANFIYDFSYNARLPNDKDIVNCIEAAKANLYCHSKGGVDIFSKSLTKTIMIIYENATGTSARNDIRHDRYSGNYRGAFYYLIKDVFKAFKEQIPSGRSIVRWIEE